MVPLLVALVWLAGVGVPSLAQSVSSPQLLLLGRFSPGSANNTAASLPQTFSWPSSSITTNFQGASSVSLTFQAIPQNGMATYAINWFRFFVDGQAVLDGFTSYNQLNLSVTIPVTTSTHTLTITKMLEGGKGEAVLQSINLSSGGRFLPLYQNQQSQKRILFLGDSLTSGYGDAGAVDPGTCIPAVSDLKPDWISMCTALKIYNFTECASFWKIFNMNSLEAFAPVAGQALGADYQVIAQAGTGLIGYAYAELSYPGLSQSEYQAFAPSSVLMFNRSIYSDPTTQYGLSSWTPEFVVVASGTNDWNTGTTGYTQAQWVSEAADFLQKVSSTLSKPTIILQIFPADLNPGEDGTTRTGFRESQQYETAMLALFAEAQQRNISKIRLFNVTSLSTAAYANWCDNHPSAVAQAEVASQLVAFIHSLDPSWNATAIDPDPPQSVLRPNTTLYFGVQSSFSSSGPASGSPTRMPPPPAEASGLSTPALAPASTITYYGLSTAG